jgi:DNA excision repair protein ERCC-3
LSLWNAAAAGMTAGRDLEGLDAYSKYDIPQNIVGGDRGQIGRYGRLKLYKERTTAAGTSNPRTIPCSSWSCSTRSRAAVHEGIAGRKRIFVKPGDRGNVKCASSSWAFPLRTWRATSRARRWPSSCATTGSAGPLACASISGRPWTRFTRAAQPGRQRRRRAALRRGQDRRGHRRHGHREDAHAHPDHQHRRAAAVEEELLDKTTLTEDEIGEYSGDSKTSGR